MNLPELAAFTQTAMEEAQARLNTLAAEHATALDALKSELATVKAAYQEKVAYQAAMESKVGAVLASGDPAQYEALATEFLTPAQELARQAKLAQLEALKAEAAALEAELAN
jgi:hypothetical protein